MAPGTHNRGMHPHRGVVNALLRGEKPEVQELLVDRVFANHLKEQGVEQVDTFRRMWPTPTGRDHKDTGDCENVPDNALLGRVVGPTKASGSLNPAWVEWLMGYEIGWTDLNHSETP